MTIKQKLTTLLLLIVGAVTQLNAQTAVTLGDQVKSEASLQEGVPYLIYQPRNSTYVKEASDRYSAFKNNSPDDTGVFYFIKVSDGVYKIKSYSTGKYISKPTTTGIAAIAPVDEASAGEWNLQYDSNGCIYPLCNGYGWDRGSDALWATAGASTTYNESGNVKLYKIYKVSLSITALSEFADKDISVAENPTNDITTGQWYLMFDRGANHGWFLEHRENAKLWNYKDKPSGSAVDACMYLVRLVNATGGKYYIQTGYGNYFSTLCDGNAGVSGKNNGTTALKEHTYTIAKINNTDGHFYLQDENNVIMDADDVTSNPSIGGAVAGWGTTVPSSTGGNNDWAFYPVELVDSWEPTINEVYTINNTNANRGAMMYNGSSSYVWSSGKSGTFSATDPNCQWVLVPAGTTRQFYLYNVGAGKFAIPSATSSTASWIFSSDAVAVTFITQNDGTKKIKTVTTDTYAAVSNNYAGPIINYNDVGGNFTITKVDGDQSTAATAAFNKLVDNTTAASAVPASGSDGWYIIRIKTHGTYADKYVYPAASEITYSGTNYPLTFDHGANIRPAIDDVFYYTRIINESGTVYWQMPNGKYLYGSGNKFPISTATKSSFSMDYTSGSGFRMWGSSRYAVPYYLGSQYFIGETASSGNAYYDLYPIDLTEAGLTAWQVIVEGLDASTLVTCTRSDVSGLTSVYTNGYFFLPTGSTPADGEFTAEVGGSTLTLPVTIDTEAHTITTAMPVLTINSPMAEATFTWNGESQTGKSVAFVYTGGTISDTNITVSYTGNEYTSPILSQTTWDGTASTTVTCTLTPAFFSASYGDKWIRIGNALGGNTVMGLTAATSGETVKMKTLDYFDDAQLWCFVGNATSFNIYNKKAGETIQMASSSTTITNDVTAVMATAGADATSWKLQDKWNASNGPGWAIFYSEHDGSKSLNAKGGTTAGNNVGYYNNGDGNGGSRWLITDASGEVTLDFAGLDPTTMTVYTRNIAVLPSAIGGSSSETLLTKDNFGTRTAYVPNNTEMTFGTPKMFINYAFTGYDGSNQTKTVTATTTPQTVTATFSEGRPDARYLWEPLRQNNADYYRIPAIVTAKNGDVIAINDRRFNNASDIGGNHHIDLIGVVSSDNGQTWGNEFMIMDGDNGGEKGYGDAAVVADRESNEVLVMACGGNVSYQNSTTSNHQIIARTVLTHNGTTWEASAITTPTSQFYSGDLASCPAMFIGSGSITQSSVIKKGDYYRIYCAVLAKNYGNYVLYSDDFGENWTYLGSSSAAASGDEAKVTELPNGSVLLSSRKSYGRYFNVWTWDDDTYTTGSWGTAVASNNQTGGISLGNNSTNGDIRMIPAIKKATGEVVTLAMQSVPTGNGRSNVSIYYKEVSPTTYTPTTIAQNWSSAFEVTPHSSAYSSFNAQPDGRIAFFMEEAPKATTESSVGYYMCYVPLTLDEITDNQYTGVASTYNVALKAVGDASYATLYLPYDVTTTGATKAYYIATANNGYAQLTTTGSEGTEIPANTAVVLINEDTDENTTLNMTTGLSSVVDESANLLKGTLVSITLDLSDSTPYYALGKKDGNIGFYKFDDNVTTTITLGANKAYLEVPASGGNVKGFMFDFDNETSIKNLNAELNHSETIYNLAGQRLTKPVKGINIINGKKVLK